MRQRPRATLAALLVLVLVSARMVEARPQQPQTKPAAGSDAGSATAPAAKAAPARPAILDQVLATVNGEPITRFEFVRTVSQAPLPPGDPKEMYEHAIEQIANSKLVTQYLAKNRIEVTEKDYADEIASFERRMKADEGRELKTALAETGTTLDELRKGMAPFIAWRKYETAIAKDAALQKYADDNKDTFNKSQVRVSHIIIEVPPDAAPAAKEAAKAKLAGIRAEIESGKISFADAANKYSEDPANKQYPNGGDLGYFVRKGQMAESFSAKAFSMSPQTISEPFETEFGYHLIKVTDRKPGQPFTFEQIKASVRAAYLADIQERIIAQMRKTSKIEIKPMPDDLFPKPAAAPPAAPGGASTPKAAAPTRP